MDDTQEEKEGIIVDRPYGSPLTEAEIEEYQSRGWKLSYAEPRITFVVGTTKVQAGPTARYIFWRLKDRGINKE